MVMVYGASSPTCNECGEDAYLYDENGKLFYACPDCGHTKPYNGTKYVATKVEVKEDTVAKKYVVELPNRRGFSLRDDK